MSNDISFLPFVPVRLLNCNIWDKSWEMMPHVSQRTQCSISLWLFVLNIAILEPVWYCLFVGMMLFVLNAEREWCWICPTQLGPLDAAFLFTFLLACSWLPKMVIFGCVLEDSKSPLDAAFLGDMCSLFCKIGATSKLRENEIWDVAFVPEDLNRVPLMQHQRMAPTSRSSSRSDSCWIDWGQDSF